MAPVKYRDVQGGGVEIIRSLPDGVWPQSILSLFLVEAEDPPSLVFLAVLTPEVKSLFSCLFNARMRLPSHRCKPCEPTHHGRGK